MISTKEKAVWKAYWAEYLAARTFKGAESDYKRARAILIQAKKDYLECTR